tara:strand:+ start:13897 stop:14643 length:747 start_codon:yes stop_codon:yes gene_type:complete
MNINNMMCPSAVIQRTYGMIAMAGATIIGGVIGGVQAKNNRDAADEQFTAAETRANAETAKLDAQKAEYKKMDFKNPFAGMRNQFQENVYEDLTVNQQQAQFQAQQGSQQRANIMQGLRGAAGSSGIAGLAQALARQGDLQTQKISASIGQQETRNQALKAKGAFQVQQGADKAQTAKMQGAQWVQQAEMDRQATLLGMQMGQSTGANLAQQQAQANQMNAQIAQQQNTMNTIGTLGSIAGNMDFTGE